MLPLQARVDLGAMAIKGYSSFTKAPALLEPHHQIVWCHIQDTHWGRSYPSAEKQSVYSTAPADWAREDLWFRSFQKSNNFKKKKHTNMRLQPGMMFIDIVYWYRSLISFIDIVHWYRLLILFIDIVYWYRLLILFIDIVYWYYSLILFIDIV